MDNVDQYYMRKCAEVLNDIERMITDECQKICAKLEMLGDKIEGENNIPIRPALRVIQGGKKA